MSQKIAGQHGGRIRVDNQLGQGARFTLELPANIPEPGPVNAETEDWPPDISGSEDGTA